MTQVLLSENEGIESAIRRFKRQVSRAGILADVKKRRYFETPQEKLDILPGYQARGFSRLCDSLLIDTAYDRQVAHH